jgi:hypothetical protein
MTTSAVIPAVSVLMVVRDEPSPRLQRAVDAVARQVGVGPVELLIAAPGDEHARISALRPSGAIETMLVVENPDGSRSAGLNAALAAARASVVARVDARSRLTSDYLTRCLGRLEADPSVGVVGAIQRPDAGGDGVVARGVARALRNPYFMGGARYRRPGTGGPADTAYLGAFRRAELQDMGGFDERLAANEDFELCARYRARGAVVWVEHSLEVTYEARATLRDLWRQYRSLGAGKADYWRHHGSRPNGRQTAALVAPVAVIGALGLATRRPAAAVAATAAGIVGLAVVDHVIAPRERDPRVRAVSLGAAITLTGAWVSGVLGGVTRGLGARPCVESGGDTSRDQPRQSTSSGRAGAPGMSSMR